MLLKAGFHIRLLRAIEADEIYIPKGDVVEVLKVGSKRMVIRDILGNEVQVPTDIKFKIMKTTSKDVKLTAAPAKKGQYAIDKPFLPKLRSIQLAQVISSNAMVIDDPIVLARLAVAGSVLSMSLSPDLDANQYNRLYQYAKRLAQM